MAEPIPRSPLAELAPLAPEGATTIRDRSLTPVWRLFSDGVNGRSITPGTSHQLGEFLVYSISPGELTSIGGIDASWTENRHVDLSHVRALIELSGPDAPAILSTMCALDLREASFGVGSAARTRIAECVTELVHTRGDTYLLAPSRSFALDLATSLLGAGEEYGVGLIAASGP